MNMRKMMVLSSAFKYKILAALRFNALKIFGEISITLEVTQNLVH